jgi:dienelactone hydrolase
VCEKNRPFVFPSPAGHRAPLVLTAAAAAALAACATAFAAQDPGRRSAGTLTEKVVCAGDSSETYTLYLPSAYRPDRQWPLLFIFDPRGRATVAANVFVEAAERYGWILASSDNTRSDGAWEPNARAIQAMWPDVRGRYAVDARRIYAAGFSGGGSVAWALAREVGGLAGVIGSGMPMRAEPGRPTGTFAFFGAAGRDDVNALDLKIIDSIVARRGDPHRLELFDGAHRWLPPELAMRAVEWFEVLAMREQRRPRDERLIGELLAKEMARAAAFEQAGAPLDALKLYGVIDAAFSDLGDLSQARSRMGSLEKSREVADARKIEKKWDDYQKGKLEEISATLRRLNAAERGMLPKAAMGELGVADLERQARRTGPEGHAARGVLEFLFVQTAYYIPRDLVAAKDFTQAAFFLSIASGIKDDGLVAYNLATTWARLGQKRKALESLGHAIDRGFADADTIEKDSDLESIRGEPGFKELLARLRKDAPRDI